MWMLLFAVLPWSCSRCQHVRELTLTDPSECENSTAVLVLLSGKNINQGACECKLYIQHRYKGAVTLKGITLSWYFHKLQYKNLLGYSDQPKSQIFGRQCSLVQMVPHEVITPVRRQGQSHLQCKWVGAFLQTTSIFLSFLNLLAMGWSVTQCWGQSAWEKQTTKIHLLFTCIWNCRKKHANAVNAGDCSVTDYNKVTKVVSCWANLISLNLAAVYV